MIPQGNAAQSLHWRGLLAFRHSHKIKLAIQDKKTSSHLKMIP
jgi:hypothetical protein